MDLWYNFVKGIVGLYTALLIKPQVYGRDRIPAGPKIIVGNHAYVSDSFILPFIFKEKLHFAIQEETFRLRIIGRLLALADQIPVVIGQGREMLKAARERLEMGHSVVIFPEGRLNHGETFHRRAGAGAAMLALQTGAPVVPVGFYVPPEFIHLIQSRHHDRDTLGGWQLGGALFVQIGEPLQLMADNCLKEYHYLRIVTDQIVQSVTLQVREAQNRWTGYLLGEGLE